MNGSTDSLQNFGGWAAYGIFDRMVLQFIKLFEIHVTVHEVLPQVAKALIPEETTYMLRYLEYNIITRIEP